jgi:hypothetical protein
MGGFRLANYGKVFSGEAFPALSRGLASGPTWITVFFTCADDRHCLGFLSGHGFTVPKQIVLKRAASAAEARH